MKHAAHTQSTSAEHILRLVYQHKQITRAELGSQTGLGPTTIIRLVGDLRDRGMLIERRSRRAVENGGRGRPSDWLEINPACGFAMGIEFNIGRMRVVITDAVGTPVCWADVHPPSFVAARNTADAVITEAFAFAAAHSVPRESVRAFGLALHDLVSADGQWLAWNDLLAQPFPMRDYLASQLHIRVHVEDVSRAFAEAEARLGAGRGVPDFIYLYIGGRGIGSGIFLNNTLMKSASGICGEIGHIVVDPEGDLCQCGNRGCLVKTCTTGVLVERFTELLRQGALSALQSSPTITFADIGRAAENGDKAANLILQQAARYIAQAMASTINVLGTPHVVIGGELTAAGPSFLNTLGGMLRQQVIPALAQNIVVRYAELPNYAGGWGVALQTLDQAWAANLFVVV